MRPHGKTKLGFFPLPTAEAERLRNCLTVAPEVPVGGGIGRVFKIARQPLNVRAQFFDDGKQPTYGPNWTMQIQTQFLLLRK